MPLFGTNIKTMGELQDEIFCLQEERDYFQSKFLEQVSEIKALKDDLQKSKKEIRRLRMFLMEQEQQHNNAQNNTMPEQIQTPKNHNRQSFVTNSDEKATSPDGDDDDDESVHVAEKDDASSLTQDEMEDLDKQDARLEAQANHHATPKSRASETSSSRYPDEENEEEEDVRRSAEKLLAWASYRSTMSTSRASRSSQNNHTDHDHSSVMSPSVLTSGSARQSLLGKMIETMEDDETNENDDDDLLLPGKEAAATLSHDHVEEKKEDDDAAAEPQSLGVATLTLGPDEKA